MVGARAHRGKRAGVPLRAATAEPGPVGHAARRKRARYAVGGTPTMRLNAARNVSAEP